MHQYIKMFSIKSWEKLPTAEKETHSRTACPVCPKQYHEQSQLFPGSRKQVLENSQIVNIHVDLNEHELNLPPTKMAKHVEEDIVTALDPVCEQLTGMLMASVL